VGTGVARITLITGAAGFAGSHLLELLARDGDGRLAAWHRGGKDRALPLTDRVEWRTVDVLDRAAVGAAIAELRPSFVYHCAGDAHVGHAWTKTEQTFATNVRGTANVLDALAGAGVSARVLVPSSALVYSPADRPLREDDPLVPSSPYGLSKLAQEMLARHAGTGVTVTVARAFNHIGARQNPHFSASGFARRIADIERGRWAPTIAVGNLTARRDLTDVRDTVRAYRLIAERASHGDCFNVCSGRAIVVGDLLEMMIARARVPVNIEADPARYRPNDTPLIVGDPGRIQSLGWTAEIPIEKAVDDILDYWRSTP
jgi:GDP-4-dehydro-6-deoxy-D-mannose reductase